MEDIKTTQDIEILVNAFYDKVKASEIGFFFNDLAQVNWENTYPKCIFSGNLYYLPL
jgi:hemoglobin